MTRIRDITRDAGCSLITHLGDSNCGGDSRKAWWLKDVKEYSANSIAVAFATEQITSLEIQARSIDNGIDLRVLPLGASITAGRDSSDGNGYRLKLQQKLEANGNRVTFVGTRFIGQMTNNACEAYPGYTIEQVDNATERSGVFKSKPNVILINVGTNDCNKRLQDPAQAPQRYANLLDHIFEAVPDALVVVSSLVPNLKPSVNTCVKTLNPGLMRVSREARARGQKTVFADMYDAVSPNDIDRKDHTHPHDAGYAKMAEVWFEAIRRSAGNITAPASGVSRPRPAAAASSTTSSDAGLALDGTAIGFVIGALLALAAVLS